MPSASISEHAAQVSGIYSDPYTLQNQGPGVVYVGSNSAVSVDSYEFSMAVGQTLGWNGTNTELWAVCAKGDTALVNYMYGAANTFSPAPDTVTVLGTVAIDGTVQVAGNVGITGPVAVSGNVGILGPVTVSGNVGITGPVTVTGNVGITGPVTVAGAVSINGAVSVAGNINVTNSTLDIAGSVTSYASAKPVLLTTTTLVGSSANGWHVIKKLDYTNVDAYASLTVTGKGYISSQGPDYHAYTTVTVIFYADRVNGNVIGTFKCQWLNDHYAGGDYDLGGFGRLTVPTLSAYASVIIETIDYWHSGSGYVINVLGQHVPCASSGEYYYNPGEGYNPAHTTQHVLNTNLFYYVPTNGKTGTLAAAVSVSGGSGQIAALTAQDGNSFYLGIRTIATTDPVGTTTDPLVVRPGFAPFLYRINMYTDGNVNVYFMQDN